MWKSWRVVALVAVCTWGYSADAQTDDVGIPVALHGAGDWATDRQPAGGAQQWVLDALRLSDGHLVGRMRVEGSPEVKSANVEARVSGRGITGALLDDEGKAVAEFDGTVGATALWGRYRSTSGDEGSWIWNGQLPR